MAGPPEPGRGIAYPLAARIASGDREATETFVRDRAGAVRAFSAPAEPPPDGIVARLADEIAKRSAAPSGEAPPPEREAAPEPAPAPEAAPEREPAAERRGAGDRRRLLTLTVLLVAGGI